MILDISHKTLYRYSAPVVHSQHVIHMSPRLVDGQTIRNHSLLVEPAPSRRIDRIDAFGNPVSILEIEVPHKELVLHARSTIDRIAPARIDLAQSTPWDQVETALEGRRSETGAWSRDLDVVQYRCASRLTTANLDIADYARQSFPAGRPVLAGVMDVVRRIHREFKFDPAATDISTPVSQVLVQRRGVCQDFSHLAIAGLRALGLPARYVSGYMLTHPPPGQPKLQGADASHAWIAAWCPTFGWVDFDPTNGLLVADEHIAIAHGRDYDDVSPISGVLLGGGSHTVDVGVDVTPVR